MMEYFRLQSLIEQLIYTKWIEFFGLIISLITLIIGINALYAWRKQVRYEKTVEALVLSGMLKKAFFSILSKISNTNEINKELFKDLDYWSGPDSDSFFTNYKIFYSRLKFHETTLKEMRLTRERLAYEYPKGHDIINLFNLIDSYIEKIEQAYNIVNRYRIMVNSYAKLPDDMINKYRKLIECNHNEIKDEVNNKYEIIQKKFSKRNREWRL